MERRKSSRQDYHVLLKHLHYFGIEPSGCARRPRASSPAWRASPRRARVTSRQLLMDFGSDPPRRPAVCRHLRGPGRKALAALVLSGVALVIFGRLTQLTVTTLRNVIGGMDLEARSPPREQINAEWARVPLEIESIAPFGSYMSRDPQLAELSLGIVVRARPATRRAHWRTASKAEGANAIRIAFRNLNPFLKVRLVTSLQDVPRPFSVVFRSD
jgi:hypothetical protein